MQTPVYYQSRGGHTKKLALFVAQAANAEPVRIEDGVKPPEQADILFLGGAIYAGNLDSALKEFIKKLDPQTIKSVAVFSTSASKGRAETMIHEALNDTGIPQLEPYSTTGSFLFFVSAGHPNAKELEQAKAWAEKIIAENA